ncbi:LLGL [Lepeophtheirus salmonis]|uniref:LLGL n=1 Tax=Lepeophtheirus salmonis TaxID=72036 RepID=A0A7R8HAK3_LEPSM|nr:LLGL [Lepeophtheirus salmonis]CAF2972602.1 LLGL [Lepeophtheirus salmonis]
MLKFIWGKGTQPVNPERAKLQKELFAFQKTIHHGFPHKPTSLAWDPELKLLAIGTKKGDIRVYGRPGVEFYGNHATDSPVTKLIFLPGQARIVSLTDDNVLHYWEINGTTLSEKKKAGLEGRLKRISCLELDSKKRILVGTEGGNIYMVNLRRFNFDEQIIYQDIVIANCNNDDFKINPGPTESIIVDPTNPEKILIGYARGLIVLWDRTTATADQSFVANQQLECLAWRNDGSEFISAHNDGTYIVWSRNKGNEAPNMPYGPYPCKAITRFHWFHQNGTPLMIFFGWNATC